jgi:hypothetical protein
MKIIILLNIPKSIFKMLFFFCLLVLTSKILEAQTIVLKNGEIIKGQISGQDLESIAITEESGAIRSISKKTILKVVNREVSNDELDKIKKEEEAKIALERKQKEEKAKEEETKKKNSAEAERIALENKRKPTFTFYTNNDKNCKEYSSSKDWFWLFGNFSITKPKWSELIPKDSKAIRIRQEASLSDTLISIIIGFAITVTRKTTYIDICEIDDNYKILSISDLEKERNLLKEEFDFEAKLKEGLEEDERQRIEKELQSGEKKQ